MITAPFPFSSAYIYIYINLMNQNQVIKNIIGVKQNTTPVM